MEGYEITPSGRDRMRRLGLTEPDDLIAVAGMALEIIDDSDTFVEDDWDDVMDAFVSLVEMGYIRWNADRHGFDLLLEDGAIASFLAVPEVA